MRYFLLFALFFLMALTADPAAPTPPPPPYAAQWKKIDALLAKDQTATAAPLVEAVYQQARRENNAPHYVRALLYKIQLLERKHDDATEKSIALLEADLKGASFPARPIIHSLLGQLYTQYLNENRYRLYQRTNGADASQDQALPNGDLAADGGTGLPTWSLGRLGAAAVRHYYQSVEDEPQRQLAVSLADLGDLASDGDAEGRALRPSLYDLLAQRAIAGLQNQELTITKPEVQFTPTDPALFGPAASFAALRLLGPDADSLNPQLHVLHLLQRLTASRQQQVPVNVAALADVDLQRVAYVYAIAQGTDLAAGYGPALTRLTETYKALPISTEMMAARAALLHEQGDWVGAVALAREAEARFPKSRGAAQARQLREEIEQPEIDFAAAALVVPGQPWRLTATVRNAEVLYATAYAISLTDYQEMNNYGTTERDKMQARVVKNRPAAVWTVAVPPHVADYRAQHLVAAGPALAAGHYLLLLSNAEGASLRKKAGVVTSYGLVGASALSAVHRDNADSNTTTVLVLDRQSGAPLAGVSGLVTYRLYNEQTHKIEVRQVAVGPSGASGELTPARSGPQGELALAHLWRGPDTLVVDGLNEWGNSSPPDAKAAVRRTFLFTDRAIYRPGQTVYFKGILTENQDDSPKILPAQAVSVRLVDPNGQSVQTLTFTTSEFGSFHGSVVLPTGLLNGNFRLQTDNGSQDFAVEDYKRPTFLVELDSVPGRPQLGQPLTVSGRARAYAGQATDGAVVKYRITRRELWPYFGYGGGYGRGGYPSQGVSSQEIAHGTTTTDAAGRFAITFTPPAGPAPAKGRWEPGYLFEIVADVTDAAGETRTGTSSLVIGNNPVNLSLTGPARADRQRLPAFYLASTNATGVALPTTGTLRILALGYRPNPPGVPGPVPETAANEAPPTLVQSLTFDTGPGPALALKTALAALPTGRYRLEAQAVGQDSAGAKHDFVLFDSEAKTLPYATPDWVQVLADTVRPGQPATLLVGSSAAGARLLLTVERGGKLLRAEWLTLAAGEQRRLTLDSGPAGAPGPLYVHTTQVRDNMLYRHNEAVAVAEPPAPLAISISTFRDKLQPGQRETWRVTIKQKDGKPADAELLATLYDQSLDVFRAHELGGFNFGGSYYPALFGWSGNFGKMNGQALFYSGRSELAWLIYPQLNTWSLGEYGGGGGGRPGRARAGGVYRRMAANDKESASYSLNEVSDSAAGPLLMATEDDKAVGDATSSSSPLLAAAGFDLSLVPARSDFRETALWEPALRTDQHGEVVLEFQMPEAVTRWQLLALAHDKSLHSGQLARQLVTQKEIQITPNAPRFLRPGDQFTFAAKFSNLTDHATQGTAQLFLSDAATGQDITAQVLAGAAQQAVSAAAHQSVALGWALQIPADFAPVAVTYKVVAETGATGAADPSISNPKHPKPNTKHPTPKPTYSDGETNTLPVLPNRLLVTESLPLSIVGAGTRTFELKKLTSTSSPTRRNQSLTLEMSANPAWYAVQSLPYLMEFPYECSEQVFSRLYANLLAAQLLKSNPRLKTIVAEWQRQAQSGSKDPQAAPLGPLEKNADLKNLLLEETPWVRDAQGETERLARLSELLDATRTEAETRRALLKLQRQQLPSGAFPWFEQMPEDRYITQLVVAGFGKLQRLGAFDASLDDVAGDILRRALGYLDRTLAADHADLLRQSHQKNGPRLADDHLGDLQIQALYARSFWPGPAPAKAAQPAHAYYQGQAAKYWPGRTCYLQGVVALALFRADPAAAAPRAIVRALSENALHSPDLGMYWKNVQPGYYWREAPTETQATLIEVYHEVAQNPQAVDELKLWLLRQKQTQHWESTRATADACYALLLRGSDWLAPSAPLVVQVGDENVQPAAAQAGTGYIRTTWPAAAVQPAQGRVSVTKADAGVAWGALYWQYFEDLDKITPAATPLSLERQLYRETPTAAGPVLAKLTADAPLRVGDALVVRLVLRTDRALEYVHLKDYRAAGLEPINQLSGYRYQNGLGYYESPKDAATNFFLSAVPRGTHVFEYRLRASQVGEFSGGLSQVQCLYAPEFSAHSAGSRLVIGK